MTRCRMSLPRWPFASTSSCSTSRNTPTRWCVSPPSSYSSESMVCIGWGCAAWRLCCALPGSNAARWTTRRFGCCTPCMTCSRRRHRHRRPRRAPPCAAAPASSRSQTSWMDPNCMPRVLVACVGNVLRGDDGFGQAVERQLRSQSTLPADVDLIETGIGGMGIVHQLMEGYESLIVVDAVDRGQRPGTMFVLEPEVPEPGDLGLEEWRERFSNLHLAEPSRILLLA